MADKEQLQRKIGGLLDEINELFPTLNETTDEDTISVDLFEATVHYFYANVSLYHKLVKSERDAESDNVLQRKEVVGADIQQQESQEQQLIEHDVEVETELADEEVVFTPVTATWEPEPAADEREEDSGEEAPETDEDEGTEDVEPHEETVKAENAEPAVSTEPVDDDADELETDIASAEEEATDLETDDEESEIADPEEEQDDESTIDEDAEEYVDDEEEYFEEEDYLALANDDASDQVGDSSTPEDSDFKPTGQIADGSEEQGIDDHEEVSQEIVIEEREIILPESAAQDVSGGSPNRPLSINELLAARLKESKGASQYAGSGRPERLTDIKSAISLNDKLLFIKDLFNGYSLAYSEAIELLNRYDDLDAAKEFLQVNYAGKNNWDEKSDTVDKLYAILEKRFGKRM